MIELLKTRFESNRIHRGELSWAVVLARLEAHPEALDALRWMEESGGALFCERRYGAVFLFHNGADSYYGMRGWRGVVSV